VHVIYYINSEPVSIDIQGEIFRGSASRLIDSADNLIGACKWAMQGYAISDFIDKTVFSTLHRGLTDLVREAVECATQSSCPEFTLETYHHYCSNDDVHLAVIKDLRNKADIVNFPIDYSVVDARVSTLCGVPVSCKVSHQVASGYFFIRLIRPNAISDNNPPHRDSWLDHLRDCVNIYVPLAGSNEHSSLSVVPGSHLWCESDVPRTAEGAIVNGVTFSVPSIVTDGDALEMVRPEVGKGDLMVFSPYLIHGGAANLNKNVTRASLEMRFWRI